MTGWRSALLAAAAVEAAAGFLAALVANAGGEGHSTSTVFATCTAGAAIADIILVPGWVWAPRPSVPVRLLRRTVLAGLTVAAAIVAAILLLPIAGAAAAASWKDTYVPLALGVPFLTAGAVAGMGALIADIWDHGPGGRWSRWHTHMVGGMAGVLLVVALATVVGRADAGSPPYREVWWPLFVLAPVTLVVGGGIRNLLMARDAVRAGTMLADPSPMTGRVVASCAMCLVLAIAAALMPA